jgi:hypothetical protein
MTSHASALDNPEISMPSFCALSFNSCSFICRYSIELAVISKVSNSFILKELFVLVSSLGGTISGEHGIGLIQKPYMPVVFKDASLEIMKGIKKAFDPNNILNAGKIFDVN